MCMFILLIMCMFMLTQQYKIVTICGPNIYIQQRVRRMQEKLSNRDKKLLISSLSKRLSWEHIKGQHRLIKHMSPSFTIPLHILLADPAWNSIPLHQITKLLPQIPFLKLIPTPVPMVKLQYLNAVNIVIVTGMQKEVIEDLLKDFTKQHNASKRFHIVASKDMKHWYSIELNTYEAAIFCKKFIRNMKMHLDGQGNYGYKIARRRVRIVLLSQDFYTILVDAMTETKAERFNESFGKMPFQGLVYYPLTLETENRAADEEIIDDTTSWELQSKSSQFYNQDKLKDIDIEKVNQGIQYEKVEAALTEEQEAVGEEQQGTWTQTQDERVSIILKQKIQLHEDDSAKIQPQSKDQSIIVEEEQPKQEQGSIIKHSQNQTMSPFKVKCHRSLSTGLIYEYQQEQQEQYAPKTSEHPTQTFHILANTQKPKYIYPSSAGSKHFKYACNPTVSKFDYCEKDEKEGGEGNRKQQRKKEENKEEEKKEENILQFGCSAMRKKLGEYITKVGRKEIDIPIYLKRQTDRTIFKNKFLDHVIRQANQARLAKN